MVKITNISGRPLSRRTPSGTLLRWDAGETRDVESKRLIAELEGSNGFQVDEGIGKKTGGGGIKTHIRHPKRLGRPTKSKSEPKEKVKPPKSVIDKVKKPKSLKKPKGLKKKKGIGIDLDGDGKVDVIVGGD